MSSLVPLLPGLQAHPSGALWLPDSETALIADLHLGYSWAQRRRGELGPLADSRTREKLVRFCNEMRPRQLVFLGDIVHAPRPCPPEREWIEATLTELAQRASLVVVRGNHDRAFAHEFGHLPLITAEFWSNSLLTAVHGDRLDCTPLPENRTLVLGHLHPSFPVKDGSGASRRLPVFLVAKACVVLPAFSPFARGYDLVSGLPEELRHCFRHQPVHTYAATSTRVVHLGELGRAIERLFAGDHGAPAQFRRHRPARSGA